MGQKKVNDLVAFYNNNDEQTTAGQDRAPTSPPRRPAPVHTKKAAVSKARTVFEKSDNTPRASSASQAGNKQVRKSPAKASPKHERGPPPSLPLNAEELAAMHRLCKGPLVPPSVRLTLSITSPDELAEPHAATALIAVQVEQQPARRHAVSALNSIQRKSDVSTSGIEKLLVGDKMPQTSMSPNLAAQYRAKQPHFPLKSPPVNISTAKITAQAGQDPSPKTTPMQKIRDNDPSRLKQPTPSKYTPIPSHEPPMTASLRAEPSTSPVRPAFPRVSSATPITYLPHSKDNISISISYEPEPDTSSPTKYSLDPFDDTEANELFKPGAAFVDLPALDKHISSFRATEFADPAKLMTPSEYHAFTHQDDIAKVDMFPPMHMIPDGVTVDDLKNNVTKPSKGISTDTGNNILSYFIDGVLGAEGSTYGISFMTLEMFRDFIQFLALTLTFVEGSARPRWQQFVLSVLPNVMSLNLSQIVGQGIMFLCIFMVIGFAALWWFRALTKRDPRTDVEDFESTIWLMRSRGSRTLNICLLFLLTTLYLPLSKLSVDALVWSSAYWPVENPYLNNTDNPVFAPLGPSETFRAPDSFCYVTSMKVEDVNFVWVVIPMAVVTVIVMTLWFPIRLYQIVIRNLPPIDGYNELGEKRTDLVDEYERLLAKDKSPYNFIYNGYRPEWGGYKAIIMVYKLFNILIVDIISKDNCLLRSFGRTKISMIRQVFQIALMSGLVIFHWRNLPYLEKKQNLSEWVSRIGYVVTSVIGLLVVLNIPTSMFIGSYGLLGINIIMYTLVVYFAVAGTGKYHSILKLIRKRLDFSIDVYSAKLNYGKHIKRRIWQETWSTLILTHPELKMAEDKIVAFSQAPYRPPYLIDFGGTVAERHIENLKVVRQIGIRRYTAAVTPLTARIFRLQSKITHHYTGPDMFYRPEYSLEHVQTYFGKAYIVPFPFSVVIVFDDAELTIVLTKEWELERYIRENDDEEIRRRRKVRQMLRALDGQIVVRPLTVETQKASMPIASTEMVSLVGSPINYCRGLLHIHRQGTSLWRGHNMNPGFLVTITFTDGECNDPEGQNGVAHATIGPDVIGLTDDYRLTAKLEQLFRDNCKVINRRIDGVRQIMQQYREHYRHEAANKEAVMSYGFFINVYNNPAVPQNYLHSLLVTSERSMKLQRLAAQLDEKSSYSGAYAALAFLYQRMNMVNQSRLHQWWYLFWDDLYRKNHKEMSQLDKFKHDFSPAYRASLPYRPLTRIRLEAFLEQRGLWKDGGRGGFLHSGILNRIYIHLNEIVWANETSEKGGTLDSEGTGGLDHEGGVHPNRPRSHVMDIRKPPVLGPVDREKLLGGGVKSAQPTVARRIWSTITNSLGRDPTRRRHDIVVNMDESVLAARPNKCRKLGAIGDIQEVKSRTLRTDDMDGMSSEDDTYW